MSMLQLMMPLPWYAAFMCTKFNVCTTDALGYPHSALKHALYACLHNDTRHLCSSLALTTNSSLLFITGINHFAFVAQECIIAHGDIKHLCFAAHDDLLLGIYGREICITNTHVIGLNLNNFKI